MGGDRGMTLPPSTLSAESSIPDSESGHGDTVVELVASDGLVHDATLLLLWVVSGIPEVLEDVVVVAEGGEGPTHTRPGMMPLSHSHRTQCVSVCLLVTLLPPHVTHTTSGASLSVFSPSYVIHIRFSFSP